MNNGLLKQKEFLEILCCLGTPGCLHLKENLNWSGIHKYTVRKQILNNSCNSLCSPRTQRLRQGYMLTLLERRGYNSRAARESKKEPVRMEKYQRQSGAQGNWLGFREKTVNGWVGPYGIMCAVAHQGGRERSSRSGFFSPPASLWST